MKTTRPFFKLLALVAALSCALGANAYTFQSGGIYYTVTNSTSKTVEVTYKDATYYSMSTYSGNITIPSSVYYSGSYYTVTGIGYRAFYNANGLKSLIIPNTVLSIGEEAFSWQEDHYSNGVTLITIPSSVTTIGAKAFYKCYSLQTVVIGDGDGATSIGAEAFCKCIGLKNVTLGKSVTSIGANVFYGAGYDPSESNSYPSNLTITCKRDNPPTVQSNTFPNIYYSNVTVYVPSPYAKTLYRAASYWSNFSYIYNQHAYDIYAGGIYYLIIDNSSHTVKVTNESGGYTASSGYSGSVTIPSSVSYNGYDYTVTEISNYAFCNSNLTAVTIPSTVATIGSYAFYGAGYDPSNSSSTPSNLTITCNRLNPPTVQSNTFPNVYYNNVKVYVPTPYAVTLYKAASYWSNFSYIYSQQNYDFYTNGIYYRIIDNSNHYVEVTNQYGGSMPVSYLTADYSGSVTIPSSVSYNGYTYTVTEIGESAFYDSNVTAVTIPSTVVTIGESAFCECNALNVVSIPNSVTTIGAAAFNACRALTEVTIPKSVTRIEYAAFSGTHIKRIVIPNNVEDIEAFAFSCGYLKEIIIGSGLKYINDYTFCLLDEDDEFPAQVAACFASTPPGL